MYTHRKFGGSEGKTAKQTMNTYDICTSDQLGEYIVMEDNSTIYESITQIF